MLLITRDMGAGAEMADHVGVISQSRIAATGGARHTNCGPRSKPIQRPVRRRATHRAEYSF